MYGSAFCRAYNEFGWNVYPEVFAGQLLEWLRRRGITAESCLDLGCGTGVLCEQLARAGIRTLGVDLSPGMIAIARERAPELDFRVGDMTAFQPEERVDLVTCTGDAVNHLFSPEDLRRMFRNAADVLRDGGWLVFDLLREEEVPDGEPFTLDYSDSVSAVFRTARDREDVIHLTVSVFENGELRTREDIQEKVHPPALIRSLLRESGFRVEQFADSLLPESGSHGTTWFVAARKALPFSKEL